MTDVLINYPGLGSLWLTHCRFVSKNGREYVEGNYWDKGSVGCGFLPDDYSGEYILMNFPVSCIRKRLGRTRPDTP